MCVHHLCWSHKRDIQWFILQPIDNDLNFCVSHWSTASQSSPLYIFFFVNIFLLLVFYRLVTVNDPSIRLRPMTCWPWFFKQNSFCCYLLKNCVQNVIGFLFFIESRPNPRELAFFFAIWRGATSSKYFYKETQRWREFRDKFTFKRWCHHGQHIST